MVEQSDLAWTGGSWARERVEQPRAMAVAVKDDVFGSGRVALSHL